MNYKERRNSIMEGLFGKKEKWDSEIYNNIIDIYKTWNMKPRKNKPNRTYIFDNGSSYDIVIEKEQLEYYNNMFEKTKEELKNIIKKQIPKIKLDLNTQHDVIDYSNVIKCKYCNTILDVNKNTGIILEYLNNNGYNINDENFRDIFIWLEDNIIKKIKGFKHAFDNTYINKDRVMLSLYGDDTYNLIIELDMNILVKI